MSFAGTNSYYGGCARNILQSYHDSLWREYIPRDSEYTETILYPTSLGVIDTEPPSNPIASLSINSHKGLPIKIFPNPASNFLHITGLFHNYGENQIMKYDIYNPVGKSIQSGWIEPESTIAEINISTLQFGIYYIMFTDTNGENIYKFVKQ